MSRRSVLILSGEPSGDLAGGKLVRELKALDPSVEVDAVGGASLRAAGANIVQDIAELSAMGFVSILKQIPVLKKLEARLKERLVERPPSVVVPIDYPGFNLRIASFAKEREIPVVYYIGPQVWAWGAGRVPKIAAAVDRMLVVFRFEADLYSSEGLRTDFVGHPLLDEHSTPPPRGQLRGELGLDDDTPLLGLLAGSRTQEVRRLLPVMLETARRLQREAPELRVAVSLADSVDAAEYRRLLGDSGGLDLVRGAAAPLMTAADALLVTSGTATLEAAWLGTPLAVLYRTSWLEAFLGRRLLKIPRISLANIVAEKDVAPEFLQEAAKPEAVAEWAREMLFDREKQRACREELAVIRENLGGPGASRRAAEAILEEARA